jgi:hypothetical protein
MLQHRIFSCKRINDALGITGTYLAKGAMGALIPAIYKTMQFSIHNLLTFYLCQAGVSTPNGKFHYQWRPQYQNSK